MRKIFLTATLLSLLFSCKEQKNENEHLIENAVENTESSIPIKRLSKTQSMLDAIYYEQIKNNEDLKNLDKRFLSLQNDSRIITDLHNEIISKSEDYYSTAKAYANNIKDSLLKKEIVNLVKNSAENYDIKVKKLNNIKRQVNMNYYNLFGYYNAFKIRKTLPEIEKYQNEHPLKADSLENFIKKQNQLINELKNLK
ncbi:hypothetical protein [Chryseobacterium daeguense]|uniref:hypothetical protein n=1 Tax=Chryseobacterium daeguense TaxID=412438 RepID=UPI00040B24DE|nr:hypothetical protein [Chryseobacterium daeguense]